MLKKVFVIGGANIDWFAQAAQPIEMHESNPGKFYRQFGGVGRNIAENLGRLGIKTTLMTLCGDDQDGHQMIDHLKKYTVDTVQVVTPETSKYLAVMDKDGEMVVAVSAMPDYTLLTPAFINKHWSLVASSDVVVIDTNLTYDTMAFLCEKLTLPIYAEGISAKKVVKLKPFLAHIHTLKVNIQEAAALIGYPLKDNQTILQAGKWLLAQGVSHVFITQGKEGAWWFYEQEVKTFVLKHKTMVNTTGSGDAFMAGVIYAALHGLHPLHVGTVCAIMTLEDEATVSEMMTAERLLKRLKELIR